MIDFQYINKEIPGFDSEFFVLSISKLITSENKVLGDITVIFVSDDYLLKMNKEYLDHDYYTDIITFDYCQQNLVSGDLFISIDRVSDNSFNFGVEFINELHRVIVHGVLHLCGYKDDTQEAKNRMRELENKYIS
jgi:probable rRNA maturation factor